MRLLLLFVPARLSLSLFQQSRSKADPAPFDRLLADAGYDSEPKHRHCHETTGTDSRIPAKKRRQARIVATAPLRREMVRRLACPGMEADRSTYRRRCRPPRPW